MAHSRRVRRTMQKPGWWSSTTGRRRPDYRCRAQDVAERRQAGGAYRCAGACRQRKN